jgi:ABC-2 type transport system permease protein
MIGDALQAEFFKLTRNRWSFLWAFAFMPAFALVVGIAEEWITRAYIGDVLPYASPMINGIAGLATMQASIFQIFVIVGAAILFGGEYRWETWRAIMPRNERTSVMIAKLGVFAIAVAASIIACGIARFIVGMLDASLTGKAEWPAEPWLAVMLGFAASFLQLMVTAGIVMLVAVVTRSMMAAIVAPLVLLVALEIASVRIRLPDADMWVAALPNMASRSIREFGAATMGDPDAIGIHLAGPGALAMMALAVAFTAVAILLFQRQDLSRE